VNENAEGAQLRPDAPSITADQPGAEKVRIGRVSEDVERLAKSWDALADHVGATPFVRPGWILAWSRAFAPDRLTLLTAMQGEELVGVLPYLARRGVLSAPANWHTPLFGCTAASADVAKALVDGLVSDAPVRADLAFLADDDPVVAACGAMAGDRGQKTIVRTILRSPYVAIEGRSWDDYRASLERRSRKDIERRLRRLHDHGHVSLQVADGSSDFESLLDEVLQLEGSGWKRKHGTAIESDPALRRFYVDVARWAGERGWLALRLLRVDGRAIASDLCLDADGVIYSLKGGFDPAFRRFGPGMLMYYESLREAFERGMHSYEMLGAEEPHKMALTSSVRNRVRLQAFSTSLPGRANHLAWSRGRPIALRVRRLLGRLSASTMRPRRGASE
jgi:CelD/BcsL family acetyltransferase involved in cellulose biosynthesis